MPTNLRSSCVAAATFALALSPLAAQMRWTIRSAPQLPPGRSEHAMVFDLARQRAVMFGGYSAPGQYADLWEWDGATWQQQTAPGPQARSMHAMAYDSQRNCVVLHGGWSSVQSGGGIVFYFSDTWEWNGQYWANRTQPSAPQNIAAHAMTYDPQRGVTVLFGGILSNFGINQNVWEWDGLAWRTVPNAGGPLGRSKSTLTYVPTLGEAVLVGGDLNPGNLADVWKWNGARWAFLGMGPAISGHGACWNPARNRLVVRGGMQYSVANTSTWEWDGAAWLRQETSTPYLGAALVHDPVRHEVLQFGGLVPAVGVTNTFVKFGPTVLPNVQMAGFGCGAGLLSAPVDPILGQTSFGLRMQQATGYRAVLLGLSTQVGVGQTLGGCTVVPDWQDAPFVAGATDLAGSAWLPMPLPSSTAFRGLQFYAQAAVLDGNGPLLGMASLSNALQVRIGD